MQCRDVRKRVAKLAWVDATLKAVEDVAELAGRQMNARVQVVRDL